MGLLKQAKEDVAAKSAAAATAEGRRVFAFVFGSSFSGSAQGLGPVAEQIEAIEAEGWRLEHFSVTESSRGANHLIAAGLFRR